MIFNDRSDAGIKLALKIEKYRNDPDSIVLAVPRGGVEVAYYFCRELNLPMELTIIKKIKAPFNPELAIGAIGENDIFFLNDGVIKSCGVSKEYIDNEIKNQKLEIGKKLKIYRQEKSLIDFKNKKVIIIDDGIATGATIKIAIEMARKNNVEKIILAVPVAPQETIKEMKKICDEVICLLIPDFFDAVGSFYHNFNQVTDEEVINFINKSRS